MPVQIQCTSIVIRNDALDRCLEGGSANFESIAPNQMSYQDDRLSQASFMSPIDAEEFAKDLEIRGLSRSAASPDFVTVHAHDQSIEPPCEWLILFEYDQRLIATIRGSDSRTVIAAAKDHDPDAIQHHSAEEFAEKFDFVERKGSIDTYREKATGKLVYHARETENPQEIFSKAFEVVWNFRREPGAAPKQGEEAISIRESIESLQSLAAKFPDVPKVALALGMAWFAIDESDKAKQHMTRALSHEPDDTMMLKEFAGICLSNNDLAEALDAATRAVTITPDDVELLGNLSVIQLVSGDVAAAQTTIQHALKLEPGDSVNHNIQMIVSQVAKGERECPSSLEEMMRPSKPKPRQSWFSKLLGR